MSTTKRTIVFIVSLFATIIFTSILSTFLASMINNFSLDLINNIINPLYLTLILFFFMLCQSFIKYMFSKKMLSFNSVLLSTNITGVSKKSKITLYFIVALIYFSSSYRNFSLDYLFFIKILILILTFLVLEMLLRLSNKKLKAYFLSDGILISGFDIKIDVPLGVKTNIYNDYGFYEYVYIEGYTMQSNSIEFILKDSMGKINVKINEDIKRKILGIMNKHNIPKKKFKK